MKFRVLFAASSNRNNPISSGYRPDWCSKRKPDYNCAMLSFSNKDSIFPGEQYECFLQPLCPLLWNNVMINDVLECMEGSRQVGEATVLEIIP